MSGLSPAAGVAFASSILTLATEAPEALRKIVAWVKGDGERPDAELAALPDLTRNHLELAALELRAAGGADSGG